ncbi:MAG: DHH family phosphoesterase, partial [Patescibacteria group bacterium]|nr:DHH family phosphoesterase [Patescibacteria group bacterium]
MPKNWQVKTKIPEADKEAISQILSGGLEARPGSDRSEAKNCAGVLAQLLYNRGLREQRQIEDFLRPRYEKLHDPFLFKDMGKAVDRIWAALERGEKIVIYGDYDADAVTANAVLQQAFRYLGVAVDSYIPDRFSEGYGVNIEALQNIINNGPGVIITVDCGTNSTDAADFCRQRGTDLIITDHHEVIGELPKAYALINPKNAGDAYPDSNITGVGVAFKLASALLCDQRAKSRAPKYVQGYEKWLLDLVAIGTVADCHSLLGENRLLVSYGLQVLPKTRWAGLRALAAVAGLDFGQKPPDAYALGFVIAPRLNAAGRLEHANIALHLLLEQDAATAQQKATALEAINRRRRDVTQQVLSEAREQALRYQDR